MSILTDKKLSERLSTLVIEGADQGRVSSCSYQLTPMKLFRAPDATSHNVGFDIDANHGTLIHPGELVWLLFRERIRVPSNLCAIWMQTNRFAREGLLLINASLVEPGYDGYLTAALVNFGKVPRTVKATSSIARIVFMNLDGDVAKTFAGGIQTVDDYQTEIGRLAEQAPRTFLDLEAASRDLRAQWAERESQCFKTLDDRARQHATDAEARQRDFQRTEQDAFLAIDKEIKTHVRKLEEKSDEILAIFSRKGALRTFAGAGLGGLVLALLGLLLSAIVDRNFVTGLLVPDARLTEAIEHYLQAEGSSHELVRLRQRVDELERERRQEAPDAGTP